MSFYMGNFNYDESKKIFLNTITRQTPRKIKYYPYNDIDKNEIISYVKSGISPYHRKYDIIKDNNNEELLILKRTHPDTAIVEVLPATECFDVLTEIHLLENHASYDKMAAILKTIYFIPLTVIVVFVKCCIKCNFGAYVKYQTREMAKLKLNPMSYIPEFTVLCTTTLLSVPTYEFTHVLIYIDQLTKYVILRPLYSNDVQVVAYELLKIFLDFGIPQNMKVQQEPQYYKSLILVLESIDIFRTLPIVIYESSIAQARRLNWASNAIHFLTEKWRDLHVSNNWAIGLKEVQWQLNNMSCDDDLKSRKLNNGKIKTPYHAHFGFSPNHNLIEMTSNLPKTTVPKNCIDKDNNLSNVLKILEDKCQHCNKIVYDIYYKTCGMCKKKCHFNCCAVNVVEADSQYREINATCYTCIEKNTGFSEN